MVEYCSNCGDIIDGTPHNACQECEDVMYWNNNNICICCLVERHSGQGGSMKAWLVTVEDPYGHLLAWKHPLSPTLIFRDVVWFDEDMSADEVRRSLIDHNGYPAWIYVVEED